jgi:hypothetical protein
VRIAQDRRGLLGDHHRFTTAAAARMSTSAP